MSQHVSGYGWLWFFVLVIAVGVLVNAVKDDIHKSTTSNTSSAGTANAATTPAPDDASLAKAAGRGIQSVAVFDKTKRKVYFLLHTSWIPGETGSGVMRYRVEAFGGERRN